MSFLSVCRSQSFEPDMSPFFIERGCVLLVMQNRVFSLRGPRMSLGSTDDFVFLNCAFAACVTFPYFL